MAEPKPLKLSVLMPVWNEETSVEDILATLSDGATPRLIVIDSIQTMRTDAGGSAPGTVRAATFAAAAVSVPALLLAPREAHSSTVMNAVLERCLILRLILRLIVARARGLVRRRIQRPY